MRRYAVKINRLYNAFDAYVAVETVLYRHKHGVWQPIERHVFDTSLSRMIGQMRAQWLADKWCRMFNAERW
ncbi:hypothetical protein PG2022B_0929 [Bifidobacterium animalis subsp. animalis]|nr:hypothetical protein PG2022B_0929 [Bifidobacterium animalis subsp. animalis]